MLPGPRFRHIFPLLILVATGAGAEVATPPSLLAHPSIRPHALPKKAPLSGRAAAGASFAVELPAGSRRPSLTASLLQDGAAPRLEWRTQVGEQVADEVKPSALLLPPQVKELPASWRSVELDGGEHALWLTFGAEPSYVVVLLSPAADEGRALSEALLLKGWLGGPSSEQELSLLGAGAGERLLLGRRPKAANLCGRTVLEEARALEGRRGRFVEVALPPLTSAERKGALQLDASIPGERDAALELTLAALPSPWLAEGAPASAWLDGRASVAAPPYAAAVLPAAVGVGASRLVVQVAAEPRGDLAAAELWLVAASSVYSVRLPQLATGGRILIQIPSETLGQCLAVVQGAAAVFSEVGALSEATPLRYGAVSQLVDSLAGKDGELAARALVSRGPEALAALALGYRGLSEPGRARAESVALLAESVQAAPFWAAVVAAGSEAGRERAQDRLRVLGAVGVEALGAALSASRPQDELKLAEALILLSPERALELLAGRLGKRSAAARLELRRLVAALARQPHLLRVLERLVQDERLGATSRIELLRAVAPLLPRMAKSSRVAAIGLMERADFQQAYRLALPALELSRADAAARKLLGGWLKQGPSGAEGRPLFALQVELLTVAREHDVLASWLGARAGALLLSPEMRVRQAAAAYVSELPEPGLVSALQQVVRRDEWPTVREQSLDALAALRGLPRAAAAAEDGILRALRRDDAPSVRARAAHALDRLPSEATLRALRRALKRDSSALVRGEAARSLGLVCDQEAVELLTRAAQGLTRGAEDEDDVRLGLAAVAALARLAPQDLAQRLAPLMGKSTPGPLRSRLESAIQGGRAACASTPKQ